MTIDLSACSTEISSLHRSLTKQSNCEWFPYTTEFGLFWHQVASLKACLDSKVRKKLSIKFISSDLELAKLLSSTWSQSKILAEFSQCEAVSLQDALIHDYGSLTYRLLLNANHEKEGTNFKISHHATVRLGRHPAYADFVVPNHYVRVDRKHAALFALSPAPYEQEKIEFSWQIRDLGTQTGTYLNGKKIQGATSIYSGDTILLGGEHSNEKVAKINLVKSFEKPIDIKTENPILAAEICVLILGQNTELSQEEQALIRYVSQLEPAPLLLLLHHDVLGNTQLNTKTDWIEAWLTQNTPNQAIVKQLMTSTLESQNGDVTVQDKSLEEFITYLKEYLLDFAEDMHIEERKRRNESTLLKAIAEQLKARWIQLRVQKLLEIAGFFSKFQLPPKHTSIEPEIEPTTAEYLEQYFKKIFSKNKEFIKIFKDYVKDSKTNLDQPTHSSYFPVKIEGYINTYTKVKVIRQAGLKRVQVLGLNEDNINSALLGYCRHELIFQWIQGEEQKLVYSYEDGGISTHIDSLIDTLENTYKVNKESLNKIRTLTLNIANKYMQEVLAKDCRSIEDSQDYKTENPFLYIFSSLRKQIFQIMGPFILLAMLGIGSRTQIMSQLAQTWHGNWLFKLVSFGLIIFFFYNLLKDYQKDCEEKKYKAVEQVKANLCKHYQDFTKNSLLNLANRIIEQEIERIFAEIEECLAEIQSKHMSRSKYIKSEPQAKNAPDLSSILTSIETIRRLMVN